MVHRVRKSMSVVSPTNGKVMCVMRVGKKYVVGVNDQKTSPGFKRVMSNGDTKHTRHAEVHALQLAKRSGGKIKEVVVLRWTKAGRMTMAKPCIHCKEKLEEAGVPNRIIWYSDWRGKVVRYE